MYSKYLHTFPFLQSDDKKKQGESSKKEIKKFRELSFHAQSSEEDGGVEVVEPVPRPSTVSCDWWRAGHVTSTLTLIGRQVAGGSVAPSLGSLQDRDHSPHLRRLISVNTADNADTHRSGHCSTQLPEKLDYRFY